MSGIRLLIGCDVFPPDESPSAAVLARALQRYRPRVALDVGCGSGYLALLLKKRGAEIVYASDHHPAAIACARSNVRMNASLKNVRVIQCDLLPRIPKSRHIDLVVFNHPLYPLANAIFGMGHDGGCAIVTRFLGQLRDHPGTQAATVLMPYRSDIPARHNVATIAREAGFSSKVVATLKLGSVKHCALELRLESSVGHGRFLKRKGD